MQRVFDVYGVNDAVVYSYRANIHDLYKRLFGDGENPADCSLVLTLKEKES